MILNHVPNKRYDNCIKHLKSSLFAKTKIQILFYIGGTVMKSNILTLSVLLLALTACGSANRLASSGQRFEDGIYYSPSEEPVLIAKVTDEGLDSLMLETNESEIFLAGDVDCIIRNSNPVIVIEAPEIDIWMGYSPSWSYYSWYDWNFRWYYHPWRYSSWY